MYTIKLSGEVGGNDFNIRLLEDLPAGPLLVLIDSGGGCSITSQAIYEILIGHDGPITTEVIRAGSGAVLPALAAAKRVIHGDGSFFIHRCWGSTVGTAPTLRKAAKVQELWDQSMASLYAERTGQSKKKILQLMSSETRLGAVEAVRLGFATEINGPVQPIETDVNLDEIALACLSIESEMKSPVMAGYRKAAEPMAKHNPAVETILTQPVPKLDVPCGKGAEALDAFVENQRREKSIRERLAVRLRRRRVMWPARMTWLCSACGQKNYHPPGRNLLATPCRVCGEITTKEN